MSSLWDILSKNEQLLEKEEKKNSLPDDKNTFRKVTNSFQKIPRFSAKYLPLIKVAEICHYFENMRDAML